jgi:hypothetical protein
VVRPETVIARHRQGFKLFWRHRSMSRKVGRPRIPREHIAFIRHISGDHPEWGEDKIAEEFDYNGARPSQATHGIPDPDPELKELPPKAGRLVGLPVLGGVQHDYRLAA